MAPEVIMAMDTGTYSGKIDIWSLGITCIELGMYAMSLPSTPALLLSWYTSSDDGPSYTTLAERRPPRFKMNAMAALYQIPQAEPPGLTKPDAWPAAMQDFITIMLVKEPATRPCASELLQVAGLLRLRH